MSVGGLDLSLTATGVALVGEVSATTMTVKSASVPNATLADRHARIGNIVETVELLLDGHAELVVIEGPSYGSNSVGSWDRAWLFGAMVDDLMRRGYRLAVAPPATVKKFASGKGNADKTAVAAGMTRLWPDVHPVNDNEFDALTLATMGAQWMGLDVPERAHHAECLAGVAWPSEVSA